MSAEEPLASEPWSDCQQEDGLAAPKAMLAECAGTTLFVSGLQGLTNRFAGVENAPTPREGVK